MSVRPSRSKSGPSRPERGTGSLNESSDPKLLYQSFRLVYNELMAGLGRMGLKKIDAAGQPFDPNYHEAVSRADSDQPEDVVVSVLQPGFMLHDKVLRPAMVQVSNGQSADGQAADTAAPDAEAGTRVHLRGLGCGLG